MTWERRLLLAFPFAIAGILTTLMSIGERLQLHRERVAGFGFLFAAPWAWLIERLWVGNFQSPVLKTLVGYAVIFWIPALLYSGCLWLLLRGFGLLTRRHSR